ncbi:MAG TPA: hypothetical protein VIF09_27790 [Polyangiaceae bacterium]|jgi:hypothetical protein
MSSESNGHKPDSQEPGPSSGTGTRSSGRAPSAWGAARDALAALRNLDVLLRSSSVLYRTLRDLLPELKTSAGVLREAFERAGGEAATKEVGEYGLDRVAAFVALLEAVGLADEEREELATRSRTLADEIEAATDLLALLERAGEPAPTEVSVDRVVREALRLSGGGRGRDVALRFDEATPDCTVMADPFLLGALVSLLVAAVHDAGCAQVVVRVRCASQHATFTFEEAAADDDEHDVVSVRVLHSVPPTMATLHRLTQSLGGTLALDGRRASLRLACPAG